LDDFMNNMKFYYLMINGKTSGPFPIEKVRHQAGIGMFCPGVQASVDGFIWKPVEIVLSETSGGTSPVPDGFTHSSKPIQTVSGNGATAVSLPPPIPPARRPDLLLPIFLLSGVFVLLCISVGMIVAIRSNRHVANRDAEPPHGQAKTFPNKQPNNVDLINPGDDAVVLEPIKPNAPGPKVFSPKELVERFSPSVGRVETQQSRGSGFLVDRNLLATNSHVVGNRDNQHVRVFFPSATNKNRGPLDGRVIYVDAERDIALVRVKTDLDFLKLGDSDTVKKGEDIVVIGSPGIGNDVLENTVVRGTFGTNFKPQGGAEFLQISLPVNHGNSGGPAFNDGGKVIGIVTAKGKKVEAITLCVPVNDLKKAIENAN
jgi:S1-C subfamily serine protease